MKLLKVEGLIALILSTFQLAWSQNTTVTLQNGLNDYTGCMDAIISNSGTGNGTQPTLGTKNEKCAS